MTISADVLPSPFALAGSLLVAEDTQRSRQEPGAQIRRRRSDADRDELRDSAATACTPGTGMPVIEGAGAVRFARRGCCGLSWLPALSVAKNPTVVTPSAAIADCDAVAGHGGAARFGSRQRESDVRARRYLAGVVDGRELDGDGRAIPTARDWRRILHQPTPSQAESRAPVRRRHHRHRHHRPTTTDAKLRGPTAGTALCASSSTIRVTK
jgi:hypothetical protein